MDGGWYSCYYVGLALNQMGFHFELQAGLFAAAASAALLPWQEKSFVVLTDRPGPGADDFVYQAIVHGASSLISLDGGIFAIS